MNIITKRQGISGDEQRWCQYIKNYTNAREKLFCDSLRATDAEELLRYSVEITGAAAGLADIEMLTACLAESACLGAAAVLGLRFRDGDIIVNGTISRSIPAGLQSMAPDLWFQALCAACLVRDFEALDMLCYQSHIDLIINTSSEGGPVGWQPFWRPFCKAFAALIHKENSAIVLAEEAVNLCTADLIGAMIPENCSNIYIPVLKLLIQLAGNDVMNWTADILSAIALFDELYSRQDFADFSGGFLPAGIAALCAIANDRGVTFNGESLYLPHWLVRNDFDRDANRVIYRFPKHKARSNEIRWFFDLEGVPRTSRNHRLVQNGDQLLASYTLHEWPGVPEAHADFILADKTENFELLDAGELVLVADMHASQVFADSKSTSETLRQEREHLQDAVDALESVYLMIPPGETRVPDVYFRSKRGRTARDAEPGRFELLRLKAVLGTYYRILEEIDVRLNSEKKQLPLSDNSLSGSGNEDDARAEALASIEIIKAQVSPILKAVALDRSGEQIKLLKPRDSDYAQAFIGEAVELAARNYRALWQNPPPAPNLSPQQTDLLCFVAPAGMLGTKNELSWNFPDGYRAVAQWLNPKKVWVSWKYVVPGQTSGLAYNGLVWCDDHWAWFPKPYQVLSSLIT
jgi:hypothetical protein